MKIGRKSKTVTNSENGQSSNINKNQVKPAILINDKTANRKRKRACDANADHSADYKERELVPYSSMKCSEVTNSLMYVNSQTLGNIYQPSFSKFQKAIIIDNLKKFEVREISSPFERRVTSIAWHPKYPEISVAGSKSGDLLLHTLKKKNDSKYVDDFFIPGVGAGGSILGLKFCINDPCSIYTASMTGNICQKNFHNQSTEVLMRLPLAVDNWFTCLDVCYNRNILMSGDCAGNSYLLKPSGEKIWTKKKLHSSKISHCEFNINDPNIFVTSSIDRTVKLWDLRSLSENKSKVLPLTELSFDKGVNTACFSPSNRLNLLVTDHHSQLRVYSSPFWNESLFITHPHRHYQHMTSIKAIWHPIEDIIIVGRYPDENVQVSDNRTIDFYDGSTGKLLLQKPSPTKHIISLIALNSLGDTIFLTAGQHVVYMQDINILNGVSCNHGSDNESENPEVKSDMIKKKKRISRKTKRDITSKLILKDLKSV